MFIPTRCPNVECPTRDRPEPYSGACYTRHGSFHPKCRARPVPRYRCRECGRTFSRQTFRMDYCDKKPHLNGALFRLLASGLGLRQSGRLLKLSRRCTELKARKIQRHLGHLNRNLTGQFDEDCRFQLDEMETFEGERGVLPVTVPVLIETRSMFVIGSDVATIKPSGRMSRERRKAIEKAEQRHGPREDRSLNALSRTFKRMRFFCSKVRRLRFSSDKKIAYGRLLERHLGRDREIEHTRISSKRKRDQLNPLRHINLTNAMARDLCGRLRRESWLVSKHRRYLRLQLHLFAAYRNLIRRRTNRDTRTPAQVLGFVRQRLDFEDLLTWRQDWREQSIHPLSWQNWTIARLRARGR